MKTLRVVAAIIENNDKILIAQRMKGKLAGLWEFPGGKVENNETGEEAIIREIEEEFDTEINVKKYMATIEHQYDDFYLVMDCFICSIKEGKLTLHDHTAYRWIDPEEKDIEWVPADVKVIEAYRSNLRI